MLIYLMGYMGSGKTTVARKLSKALAYAFLDLDNQVEFVVGKSVSDYFNDQGEDAFRKIEQEELHKTFSLENTVVSLGGGTPCFFDNLDKINQNGTSVYLKLSSQSLASRLENAKNSRPLIKDLSGGELFEFVQQQLGDREQFYNHAHILIKGESLKVQDLVDLIKSI